MKSSHNIWIPSLQNSLRFNDLSFDQYRCMLRIIDDNDLEFISTLNDIINDNIVSKFDPNKLTTLDRFIIFLSLKINSCGSSLILSKKCDKCETTTSIKMDLNQLVDNIAPNIDRQFTMKVDFENFSAICDIPTIKTEHEIYTFNNVQNIEFRSLDFNLNNYVFSHITGLQIENKMIDLNALEHVQRLYIMNKLPAGLINQIQGLFLKDIHDSVLDIDFLQMNCQKCKEHFEIKFDITNINDILKIIYKDESLENLMNIIINISSQTYLGGYISQLSPMEVNMIHKTIIKSQKQQEAQQPQQSKDLFSEYREQTKGMSESPSEFGL